MNIVITILLCALLFGGIIAVAFPEHTGYFGSQPNCLGCVVVGVALLALAAIGFMYLGKWFF